jgi:hypothetical protein
MIKKADYTSKVTKTLPDLQYRGRGKMQNVKCKMQKNSPFSFFILNFTFSPTSAYVLFFANPLTLT